MDCIDYPCKFRTYDIEKFDGWCSLLNCAVPDDIDETGCEHFQLAKTCLDCAHSDIQVYETGTIDDIEYRCPFQNRRLIYDDSNCGVEHYTDVPECNCGKFELS